MSTPAGSLMIGVLDHCVCIKVRGRANFTSGVDLKKVVAKLNGSEERNLIFDLADCLTMDSTFLGVLSGIGLEYSNPPHHPVKLANMPLRISDLIEGLGVTHLFDVCTATPTDDSQFEPCEREIAQRSDVTRTCLEAHKLLMDVNPENIARFKDVTKFLADDLQKQVAVENQGKA